MKIEFINWLKEEISKKPKKSKLDKEILSRIEDEYADSKVFSLKKNKKFDKVDKFLADEFVTKKEIARREIANEVRKTSYKPSHKVKNFYYDTIRK